MPSTLLAVDDSATMRKVLEITFTGPDFNVTAVASGDAALDKLKSLSPDLVVCDVSLDPKSGYDVCKAIKAASPSTPVLLLSSKQNPYDAAKGQAAGADDHMDKPFDTQQMLDRAKKLVAGGGAKPAAAPAAAASPARTLDLGATMPLATSPLAAKPAAAAAAKPAAAAPAAAAEPAGRAKTLLYSPGQVPVGQHNAPTPAAAPAAQKPAAAAAAAAQKPAAAAPAAAVALPKELKSKLDDLGLTPAQVDAVLALSREVVERVVWEVVPVLAETIIKEELSRLTK